MEVTTTSLPEVLIIEPKVLCDERGFFFESFNQKLFEEKTGLLARFVQDNHSRSRKGVLRGLHYQIQHPQGKLVRVVHGLIFDVVVDIRKGSQSFGRWDAIELSDQNKRQIWVPPGFAHGFLVLSDTADILYKTTDYWYPEYERCIQWNDASIGIAWPLDGEPTLSTKDAKGQSITAAEVFE
jgi:dTDP-4-dehydrorhamnose 3,5-epimerase